MNNAQMDLQNIEQALSKKFGSAIVSTRDALSYIESIGQRPHNFYNDLREKFSVSHGKMQFSKPDVSQAVETETDAEIEKKLNSRFHALTVMANATAKGINRALIISGPAGLGKSHSVEQAATEHAKDFTHIKGYIRPTGLYKTLYANRNKGDLVVFDDIDNLFSDELSLNLLKAACDSSDVRHLSWLTNSTMEDEDGEHVPNKFEFEGSIIFITNLDFQAHVDKGTKFAPHFEALISRSHYLDLGIKNKKDYIVRIKQVLRNGMLDDMLLPDEQNEIVFFLEDNMNQMRELSLRMVKKLADLMIMDRTGWKELAKVTCMLQK